jgi:hypothetical protein
LFSRYRDPPRRFEFEIMREDTIPELAQGGRLSAWFLQDDTGAETDTPVQITRINPRADVLKIEAEEMLFTASDVDLANRLLVVDSNNFNVNMRTAHDAIYPDPVSGDEVTLRVNPGVILGSTSVTDPALTIGDWPAGVTLNIEVYGRIQGCGAVGGTGQAPGVMPPDGGVALYTRETIILTSPAGTGEIWSGGGGGQGGIKTGRAIGGGGGAGTNPGTGGGGNIAAGSAGTATAGGAGGADFVAGFTAGTGGGPGLAGSNGTWGGTHDFVSGPSSAGAAIDGNSFITFNSPTGLDIRGSQIN